MESIVRRIAYFISPHGLGHAARASAVMEAARKLDARLRFEIFTEVPEWFFGQSLTEGFTYQRLKTDLGLVQKGPFEIDLAETIRGLDEMLPFDEALIKGLARKVTDAGCEMIVCDIAPVGILAARAAGLPSVLVENFTWDWIYEAYAAEDGRIRAYADYLREIFETADYHIQTEPVCAPDARRALVTPPLSREARSPAHVTRERLGIPSEAKAALITLGGFSFEFPFLRQLEQERDIFFLIPGGSPKEERRGNMILLPYASGFHHPDLVRAADAVVGKIGYSTLAECFRAGRPFCYVMRRGFRESPVLAKFARRELRGRGFSEEEFQDALWLPALKEMLLEAPLVTERPNGALQVASFLIKGLRR